VAHEPASDHTEQLRAWLVLLRTPGLGPQRCARLLQEWPDARAIIACSDAQLKAAGVPADCLRALRTPDPAVIDQDLRWLAQPANHLITRQDPLYPQTMLGIPDPPPALFCVGQPEQLNMPQIAIVGSRNPTLHGAQMAEQFARQLAAAGLTVTSGLALGIDGAAHKGALQQGHTIAVTATGLDRVYPAQHRELAHGICDQGAMISEFPPGTGPKPGHFPRRNRIISAMSLGVLVIEATPKSGSLITARLAGEQGREVFAMPGSILNPLSRGCHQLIREGAKLVESVEDIIEELTPLFRVQHQRLQQVLEQQRDEAADEGAEDALLRLIGFDPISVDQLVELSKLGAAEVMARLTRLELDNRVESLPGGRYCRVR
jgi:DNA processing protein